MLSFVVAFMLSLIVTTAVIRYDHLHQHWTADHDVSGVQKFHAVPVPRIGGLGIGVALLGVLALMVIMKEPQAWIFSVLLLCSLPAYLGGIVEDITKQVSALNRLWLTMAAAVAGYFFLGAKLAYVDITWVDMALEWWPLSLLVTAIAVGGLANAINIIDGYNGLSGMVACVILAGLAYVAFKVDDVLILRASLAMIGAVLGFFIWNWPWGKIFLGDGGAYLLGFWIAELSLLLLARNPQVSPWFPLLLVAYPVVETLFSIYRRVIVRQTSPGMPDAVHLHQLVFRRLVRWSVGNEEARHITQRNSMTAPYLWLISSLSVFPAVLLWRSTWALQLVFFIFAAFYIWFYLSLIRFKALKWLIVRKKQ